MAASQTLAVYRVVFAVLGCLMLGTLIYTIATDGSPFRRELLSPWMVATLADFYVNVVAISIWVIYKESSWISSVFWVVLLFCFGSVTTCAYIVKKLFEISPTGPAQDPVDLLLVRNEKEDSKLTPQSYYFCTHHLATFLAATSFAAFLFVFDVYTGTIFRQGQLSQMKCSFVIFGRILFSILGIVMAAVVTYTVLTDGSPFRRELLTPWMAATLIDFYINVFAISVWVAHKETTWISACIWIILLICFGSITTCAYIVIQLFQVSYQDPIYHVLLNSHGKYGTAASM